MQYYISALSVISSSLCIALGLFTLLRNPRNPVNIGFTAGMMSLAVIEAGGAVMSLSPWVFETSIGIRITIIGQALLPVTWFFFSIVFARADCREALRRWAPVLALFTGATSFFIIRAGSSDLVLPSMGRASVFSPAEPLFVLGGLGKYFYMYLLLGLVLSLAHLENTLRSSAGGKRWRIKYLVFGVGAVLAYFIYLSSETLLFSTLGFEVIPLTASVVLISVSFMAVSIVKYRLLDVDIFISRHVVYNSVVLLAVGLYLLAVGIVSQGIKFLNLPFNYFLTTLFVFISALALVVFFFAATLRRKAQLFINRNFYKHKYEFRDKWMETIEKISTKRSVEEIIRTLKEMITGTMGAEPVHIWLYDPASESFIAAGQAPGPLTRIPADHPFARYLRGCAGPFTAEAAETGPDGGAARDIFRESGAILCSPLMAAQEAVGFVMLGPDHTGEPYIEDDREFLKALTTQAAVQIKNINLMSEIMSAKEVEAFSRMSYFIMHDLKNLTNSLSLISQNARFNMDNPEFQRDAVRTIDGTVARMKRLIDRLSNVKKDFELKKEWTDLGVFMDGVLKKLVLPKDKFITVATAFDETPSVCIDREAIEMIILNLMVNAYEAIQADGIIKVATSQKDGFVNITVSDNGPGIPKDYMSEALFRPFKTTKKSGFGIGLFQCKAVAEAHGGGITVESEEGKGAVFILRLPAGEDFPLKNKFSGYNV